MSNSARAKARRTSRKPSRASFSVRIICANCHRLLGNRYVLRGRYKYHSGCPKIMIPLETAEAHADRPQGGKY